MRRVLLPIIVLFFAAANCFAQGFQVASISAPNGTYKAGQTITFTVTFETTVNMTGAVGTLALNTTPARNAVSASTTASGVSTMTLTYTVQAGDVHNNSELDYVAANSFSYTGTIVRDTGGGQALTATSPAPGAAGSIGATSNVLVDGVAPTAAITYSDGDALVKGGQSLTITATFSEAIADAPVMQISLAGANTQALTNMTKTDATHYTYNYSVGAGDGAVTVSLGTGTDAAGNVITATPTSGGTYTVDNTAPTSSAGFTQTSLKNGTAQTVTITFGEAVTGTPTITLTGSTSGAIATNQAMTGGPTIWTYAAGSTWTGDQTVTATVGTATDAAGNVVAASPSTNTFTVDNTGPTSTATYTKNTVKNGDAQTVTVTFGEAVTGTPTITLTGSTSGAIATAQAMTGGPTVWTYAAGTTWTGDQTVTVTVGTATDALGNVVVANPSTNTFTVDNTGPTSAATYTKNPIKNGTAQTVTVTFGEAVTGTPTITITGSTSGAIATAQAMTGGPTVWTYAAGSTWAVEETFTVTVGTATDATGNVVNSTPATNTFTIDNTAPTSSAAFTQNFIKNGVSQTVTITFNESIVVAPKVTLTGSSSGALATNQTMSGGPTVWTYAAGTTWSGNETVTATVNTGTDAAGNVVASSPTTNTFTVDNTAPTVTINQDPAQTDPGFGSGVLFRVVFSEPINVSSFAVGDVTGTTGTATGEVVQSVTEVAPMNGTTFQVSVTATGPTPTATGGTVIATIAAGGIQDLANNNNTVSTSTDNSVTLVLEPSTPPTSIAFSSITQYAMTVTRTGGNGNNYLLVARQGAAVNFTPVDGTDYASNVNANFNAGTAIDGNGNKIVGLGTSTFAITGLNEGTTYHYAIFSLNGATTSSNYNTTGTINSQATTACSYPAAPTTLTTSSNTTTITVNFSRATNNDEYIIIFKTGGIPASTPVNGTNYTSIDNLDFSAPPGALGDGFVVYAGEPNNTAGAQSRQITGLSPGVTYGFAIYTYNPTGFCYQTTGLTGTKATTTSTLAELTVSAGAGTEPATISSLGTAISGAVGPQTNAVQNFDFTVTDASNDGASGLISQVVINQGPNNQIADWSQAISAVQLSDGTNNQTTNITINPTNITIASIPNGAGALGRITEGGTKTYTLTVALKTALGGTLPTSIDGKQFDFNVNTASFTASGSGSTFAAAQDLSSGASKNVVAVVASKITVTTQPSAAAVVNVGLSTQPKFTAQDANNNTDLGFNNALTVATTNPNNLNPTSAPSAFVNGVADFTSSGFKFLSVGSSTMNVTANSITSTNTNSITVTSTTALNSATGGLATSPINNSSTNQGVFGFSLATDGASLNLTSLTISTTSDPALVMSNFRLYGNSVDNFATASDLTVGAASTSSTTVSWATLAVPLTSTIKYFYLVADVNSYFQSAGPTIQFSLPTSGFTVSLSGASKTGATQFGTLYTLQDITPPAVSSITVSTVGNPALNGIGSSNGTTTGTSTLTYTVTYAEPVTGVGTNNFSIVSLDNAGNVNYPAASSSVVGVSGSSTTYTVTAAIPSGTGRLRLDFSAAGVLKDLSNNAPVMGFYTGDVYNVVLPEPQNNPSSLSVTPVSTSQIQVSWGNTPGGALTKPSHVLILAKGPDNSENPGAFAAVNDGVYVPNDTDFSDGNGAINISLENNPGTSGVYTFPNMRSGKTYDFIVYSYNLSPNNAAFNDNINFVIGGNPTNSATTLTASVGTLVAGNTAAPATIAATSTSYGAKNFTFKILDDGATPGADDAKFLFTQLVISGGSFNNVTDWSQVIEEAELHDVSDNNTVTTTTIGTNTITFSGLSTANNAIGELDDNELKEYELRIRLKNPMSATAKLNIDNQIFDFLVTSSSFTTLASSSKINVGQAQSSGNNNQVIVTADRLTFATQPPSTALVLTNLTTTPVIRAVDGNGNVDRDYAVTLAISNAGSLPMSQSTLGSPVAGIYTFPLTFQYTDDGAGGANNGDLTLTGTGLAFSNTVTSSNVTVTYSNTTTIIAGALVEQPNFLSTNSNVGSYYYVFDFMVQDDNLVGGDGSPTRISQIRITKGTGNGVADWSQAIAEAILYEGTVSPPYIQGVMGVNDLTFSGISNAVAGNPGYIPDNGSKFYRLYIRLKTALGGTLPFTIDNQPFVFEVLDSNITLDALSSSVAGGEKEDSGPANNTVRVYASQVKFTTNPAADMLVNKDISLQLPKPVVEAVDVNNNRDLDYTAPVTITNAGSLAMTLAPTTITNGIVTFADGFQYDAIGNGTLTATVATANANAIIPSAGSSTTVTVRVASSTTITAGATAEPATISSLTTTAPGVQVFDFKLTDDGGAENDGNATQVYELYITSGAGNEVTSTNGGGWFDAIAGATLSDGTNTVNVSFIHTTSDYMYFDLTSVTGQALGLIADGANKTFKLNIWLKSNLGASLPTTIDGLNFTFNVQQANVHTTASSTAIIPAETTFSSISENEVTVVATQLDVTTPAAAAFVSINNPFTPVLEARDINKNRDLDFEGASGTITAFSNTSGATMANGPVVGATQFSNGIINFSSAFPNFQFTTGNNNDNVTLSIKAGTGTTCGTDAICSSPINPTLTLKTNTITAGVTAEPASISSLSTSAPGISVFDFKINDDDNQITDTDGKPTKITQIVITPFTGNDIADWTELIASATLNNGTTVIAGTVNATNITFSGIASSVSGDFGFIDDNLSKTFTLNIVLKSVLGGTLPSTVDNLNLTFEVLATNINVTLPGSTFSTTETENSGSTNNAVQVIATKLKWTTNPAADILVNKDISLQPPVPVIQALDANNNRDLNFVTPLVITNTGVLPMSSSANGGQSGVTALTILADGSAPLNGGIYTFTNDFQYDGIGSGATGNGTMTAVPSVATTVNTSHPERISSVVTVRVASSTTITAGALVEPATISSLVDLTHTPAGLKVFDFAINDDPGGTPPTENDGNPTRISSITITQGTGNTITDWTQVFSQVMIDDGTGLVGHSGTGTILADKLVFGGGSGIPNNPGDPGEIVDDGSKTYTLTVWLKTALGGNLPTTIDGLRFAFNVTAADIVTNANGTAIIPAENENSDPTNALTNNKVTVVATQIDYSQLDNSDNFISPYSTANFPANGSIFSDFVPRLGVEAHDANANLDKDFTSSITSFAPVTAGVTTQNDPSGAFSGGRLKFPANFQYVTGNNQDGKLRMTAGGISNQDSPTINIISSFDSWLYFDPTFSYTTRIPYVGMQETTLTNTTNSVNLARLILSDGGAPGSAVNPSGTKNLPLGSHNDLDGAFTKISQFTISLTNFADIRKIALFDAGGNKISGTEQTPAATVTFTGLNSVSALTAADNDVAQFYIRASFNSTIGADLDQINIQITDVVYNSGSHFPISDGTTTMGGVDGAGTGGDSSDPTQNFIDVVATSLDFVTPASLYAGTNEPLGATYTTSPLPATSAAIVHARDKFAHVDLDFDYTAAQVTVSGGGAISFAPFVDGVLNLDGMIYKNSGNGTLTVSAGGLDSSVTPSDNIGNHTPGQLVNVVHVGVTQAAIPTPSNLKGGTPGAVLLGVTFTPEYATTTEPSLKKFIFSFKDNPYQTATSVILKNFKVRLGSTDVTTTGATVTTGSSTSNANLDLVIVDWGSSSVGLFDVNTGAPSAKTFYLVADIDVTAKIGTPSMTPQLIDAGYGTASDKSIIITKGTARSNIVGTTYTFASTRPPVLLTSSTSLTKPYNGQLNVDKNITEIQLEFDIPVWSLDGKAELYDRNTNVKVADLVAIDGNFTTSGTLTPTANPIRFGISFINGNSFQDDGLYYVTIKKGTFDNLANNGNGAGEGISDDGFNYFGGISSNSILFFKISSPNPPVLSLAKGLFANLTTAAFQTTFDQRGTAYYMVVPAGSVKPSNSDILGTTTYPGTVIQTGSYPITLVNAAQSVTVTFGTSLVASTSYDVWIFAKNDANPANIPTTAPYGGGPTYSVTGTTPTMQFTTPTVANLKASYQPDYTLCPNSFFTLTDPIIIGEQTASDFYAATVQDFNILLPSGFEFDGINKPTVQLIGSDFVTTATVNWVNNTIINIRYGNTGTATLDKIIITNMRIRGAEGSNPGVIRRFAGDASIGPIINLATIANLSVAEQQFTNSYSVDNDFQPFGFPVNAVITAIPDNYIDTDASISGSIRLIPQITPANDYGVTFFNGNGVTNDVLSLGAVARNTAFDITMTHTDLNGCVSENDVQYVVYDHTAPISPKLGSAPIIGSSSPLPGGTQEALNNTAFPALAPAVTYPNASLPRINYKDLAGYKFLSLSANIPTNVGPQIISGAAWETQVNKIPVIVNQITTDTDLPTSLGFTSYKEYQWDYTHILNAVSESSSAISVNPYDNFKDQVRTFWRGGSLGRIQFTGTFQNTADLSVIVPFRQEVELFAPPIPLIEIASANQSSTDAADATVNTVDSKTPSQRFNTALYGAYPGVPIFCEAGGIIRLNGFPAAVAGTSTGSFAIYNYDNFNFATGTGTVLLPAAPNSPFVDNGNGTATLDPSSPQIKNLYKDIVVAYTFQEDNSPAKGTSYLVMRITPNPIASISVTGPLCVSSAPGAIPIISNPITFNGSTSAFGSASAFTNADINNYLWSFGDAINSTSANPNSDTTSTAIDVTHKYISSAQYVASLIVTSRFGCVSQPSTRTIGIGGIPTVDFDFRGVSVADAISFTNASNVNNSAAILNDAINNLDWTFDDGSTLAENAISGFASPVLHTYAAPNVFPAKPKYNVNLKVTSKTGCVNNVTKAIIVLPRQSVTPTSAYFVDYESSNGNWIPSSLPISVSSTGSWKHGTPAKPGYLVSANGSNVWKTEAGILNSYGAKEKSALYSPSFDISQLQRPMISFNTNTQMHDGDGVVLEYSVDDRNVADANKVWIALGQTGEGVDWFNAGGLAGSPGDQSGGEYGWSGIPVNPAWLESKHHLNVISLAQRVVFRFALGVARESDADAAGFAFDNLRVGERTRIVLLENFTNLGNDAKSADGKVIEETENTFIGSFIANNTAGAIVKIDYHTAFPKPDPLNMDNEQDPGARALYYNISKTPRVRMDGELNGNDNLFSLWGTNSYSVRSLKLADAEITPTITNNSDGSKSISVSVKALKDLGSTTILNMAIVEKDINKTAIPTSLQSLILINRNTNQYVLKKLLPNAAGTVFGATLPNGQSRSFGPFTWNDKVSLYAPVNDLALVIFLQDEKTREIYQTEISDLTDPSIVTDVEDINTAFNVYPNPADRQLTIELPEVATQRSNLQMFDQLGKVVHQSAFEKGDSSKTVDTETFAGGVYIIQIETAKGLLRRKVMVLHHN